MRNVIYSFLCVAIAFGVIANRVHVYHISQYQKGKDRLELNLQKDERFRNVRIFFYSTRPSAWVLAPRDLSPNAKQELEHLVSTAFGSLPVPIRYAGPRFFGDTNEVKASILEK